MENRPEQTYSQTMLAPQRYCTKFEWVLPDWSLLYDSTYSKGIKSDSFPLDGVPPCTCRLFLNLEDEEHNIHILLSDPASILGVKVTLSINEQPPRAWSLIQPVGKSHRVGLRISEKKKALYNVLDIEPSKEAKDVLIIVANFVVTPFPAPLLNDDPAPTDVLKKIKDLFDDKKFCDVTVVLNDEEIPVHKTVLASHSEVFQAMFLSAMTESEESKVRIVDIDSKIFKEFLNYLYTGRVDNLKDSVEEMIMVAEKYQVMELKALCQNHMLKNLSTENIVRYSLIADKLCCVELRKKALDFLQNSPSVFQDVIKKGDLEAMVGLSKIFSGSSEK